MTPHHQLEDQFNAKLKDLLDREAVLEQIKKDLETAYSGLRDIDDRYSLISHKLTICLEIITQIGLNHPGDEMLMLQNLAGNKAREAVRMLEDLIDDTISEDQKEVIVNAAGYKAAKDLLYQVLLKGGGVFFETKIEDKKKVKKISRIITNAILKFSTPDDNYSPLFKTEELSGILRRIVDTFLPVLGRPYQKPPPYGIEEGEEVFYSSKKIKLPLSQAIYYLENEVVPKLQEEIKKEPGNRELQHQLAGTEKQIEVLKQTKFFPRSSPVFPEKGFYSDSITGYTEDGEMLIPLHIPVIYKSGTNLGRMQVMVCAEITRKLAGKGLCPELDKEYAWLKRIESGKKGNSRNPSFALNTYTGFKMLKNLYPFMAKLENKQAFKKLLGIVNKTDKKYAEKFVRQFMAEDELSMKSLP
ncbi:MAG: hypothetical protein JXJ04_08090 [Spirochaetales bacterium]|nr:hypothetical protein [Spirochaetales bacterium]